MSNRTQTHVPAVDTATTGHLPYAAQPPEPTRARAEQPETDGAREHTEPEADLTKLIAAQPADQLAAGTYDDITTCVYDGRPATAHRTGESGNRYGMCAACAAYTAATDGLSVVQHATEPAAPAAGLDRLTAAQRGPEWMNKWGCPGFCIENHGTPGALECHSTAPVETSILATDMDCSGYSANGESLPWMTAQVIVNNDKAAAYGRETRVWIGYGVHLAEISPAEARKALDALRGFTARLSAVVDFAEQVAAGDFEGDPEIAAADRAAEQRRIRAITARAGGAA